MRDVLSNRGKNIMPGDRGSYWFKFMTPLHYVLEEYQNHRYQAGQSQQFSFAFGKSNVIKGDDLSFRLYRLFASLRKLNRRVDEIEQGSLRQLIFVTFHSAPVAEALDRLGFKWLGESGVMIWDLRRDRQLESRFDKLAIHFEYVLESLGIRFEDTRFGNLSRCSGNTAVLTIQPILALFYANKDQKGAFTACRPLCWLRYTWVGHTLDQTNVAPGEGPKRRDDSQMNCNSVPQRRNEKAFG
ncbi:hypothetical protein FGRMN_8510 [Fusarium graminum]|nr:hypothetical protein FGRMN_8510 [Fusarium graminum]